MIILEKELNKIELSDIIRLKDQRSADFMDYSLDSLSYEVLLNKFNDLCFDNDIYLLSDLLNTDAGDRIISEYTDLENLKNLTGVMEPDDYKNLIYFDLSEIKTMIPEPDYLEKIQDYLWNAFRNCFPWVTNNSNLYDYANSLFFDNYQTEETVQFIKNGDIKTDTDLSKWIISNFCPRCDFTGICHINI